jgi:hypothetical protein
MNKGERVRKLTRSSLFFCPNRIRRLKMDKILAMLFLTVFGFAFLPVIAAIAFGLLLPILIVVVPISFILFGVYGLITGRGR